MSSYYGYGITSLDDYIMDEPEGDDEDGYTVMTETLREVEADTEKELLEWYEKALRDSVDTRRSEITKEVYEAGVKNGGRLPWYIWQEYWDVEVWRDWGEKDPKVMEIDGRYYAELTGD